MALTAYMSIKGTNQGDIEGDCPQKGDKEKKVILFAVDHAVEIPRDVYQGNPTGQRIHKPLTVTKIKDLTTPKLFQACCTGEQLKVTIDFYRITPKGTEEKYFVITLEEAIIVNLREFTPTTFLPENKSYYDMEEVSFTYSKINWAYGDGKIGFTDSWK